MDKIIISKPVFEKVANTLASMPYSQVAPLLQELGADMKEVSGEDDTPTDNQT